MSKYFSKKFNYDGKRFDSKKEAQRYYELKLLEKAKEIEDLECQPSFVVVEMKESTKYNGRKLSNIKYIADFIYKDIKTNKIIVEDVKSEYTRKDAVYRIKMKLFINKYGNEYEFREVI